MLFVSDPRWPSYLKPAELASEMGCRILPRMDETEDETVVFVKRVEDEDIQKAKRQGCRIVYDPMDYFCYPKRQVSWGHLVDVVVVPNKSCIDEYRKLFPLAQFVLIPEHAPPRLKGMCEYWEPKFGYIGAEFNMPKVKTPMTSVLDRKDWLDMAPKFNLHLCVSKREGLAWLMKPASKLAMASAVGACAVVYKDPSAVELLGEDYPFYVKSSIDETAQEALSCFGDEKWYKAKRMMKEVKERTSVSESAKSYTALEVTYA